MQPRHKKLAQRKSSAKSAGAQNAAFHTDRGLALLGLKRMDEALASFNQALQLEPNVADRHYNCGVTLKALDRLDDALASYDQAIRLNPGFASAYNNRGLILHALKRFDEALASFERALALNPAYAGGHFNLGNVQLALQRFDEARASFERALAINPEYAEAHNNRGNALRKLKHLDAALGSYDRAIQLQPDLVEAHINRGVVLGEMGRYPAALESLARAIAIKPDDALAYKTLADIHHQHGDMHAAVKRYRQALSLDPTMVDVHSSLIFQLDLLPGPDTAAQQQERRLWNQLHAEPLMKARDYTNDADPQRRLRIGYVSGDFNNHSAASSFQMMLGDFDRTSFEVIAYSNSRLSDEMTSSMQSQVTLWRDICNLSDEAAADLIVGDRIDLLVDLSGHTLGNRLLVFARSPAPVQVSAIGYPTGTGMRAMDAVLSDAVVIPPEERDLYAEEVRYLPSVLMYSRNLDDFPPVNELPALSSNVITFGSFNRMSKITEESLTLWAYLLQVLPQSELLLKAPQFDDQAVRQWLMVPFTKAGIDPKRIRILGTTPWVEHMKALNQVDIALDTLPHGGGITTLESIAMGVPVISLRWPTFTGRTSASILTTLALTDWIAENVDEYIKIAIEKSRDIQALAALRGRLRAHFAASHFGDSAAALRTFENEYRKLWQQWCARR